MNVEIFGQLADCLIQVSQLALEVRGVVTGLVHAHNGQTSLLEAIALLLERDYSMTKYGGQMMQSMKYSTSIVIDLDRSYYTYSWRCLDDS